MTEKRESERHLCVSNLLTRFSFVLGDEVITTNVICRPHQRLHWSIHNFAQGREFLFFWELQESQAIPGRSNPFLLFSLRYSVFPIISIIWVIFKINGEGLTCQDQQ